MRVLVTGGAGFIGSHVVDRLRAAGHEPVIFDTRLSEWHPDGEVAHLVGDLLDRDGLVRALAGCDAVAHLAAAADVGEVAKDPVGAEELNARGTLSVLEAAREAGVKRVVYASTIWVYDGTAAERVDEETPLGPPVHLYTATKLAGEHYCRSYAELYGLEPTILRFGIPYGPRAREAAVVPSMVNRAFAGEPLTIAGTGEQTRRFVYVEDLAEGVVRGLRPEAAGRTYNLVSEEETSIREIADTVCATVADVGVQHGPGRAGDFKGAVICGERARRELGWEAETPFAEGVRRYVAWRRERAAAAAPQAAAGATSTPAETAAAEPARAWKVPSGTRGVIYGLGAAILIALITIDVVRAHDETRALVTAGLLAGVLTAVGTAEERWLRRGALALAWVAGVTVAIILLAPPVALNAAAIESLDRVAAFGLLGAVLGATVSLCGRRALQLASA